MSARRACRDPTGERREERAASLLEEADRPWRQRRGGAKRADRDEHWNAPAQPIEPCGQPEAEFGGTDDFGNAPPSAWTASRSGYRIGLDDRDRPSLYRVDGEDERLVSGAVRVVGITRNPDGTGYAVLVQFADIDGRVREWLVPRSMLAGEKVELHRQLLDRGLFVVGLTKACDDLVHYLHATPPGRFVSVTATGWHGDSFVLASGTVRPKVRSADAVDYLLANAPPVDASAGTLEGWRSEVAARCVGNSRPVLGVSIAFASPLMPLGVSENGGVHLRAKTSVGKSEALRAGASVWRRVYTSWKSTDAGLEGEAAAANDLGLFLDEIGEAPAYALGDMVYLLGKG